ncbi:TetR/AcrR family transcriptional regulator [Lentilactobacillus parafarraginis]|uniref:Transcriptional regulator, TetR family n=1 Tax=Lentilactobacillus parafarraginis DSM 18390 = JCM 14109 TaxID=1423786 RepID=A0A0R1YZH1_9LACO|nr:TetR/AcrR family transcriptional regulator [Lentilactobacillus parafarraginis]KRM44220.1 transcriptional regulator, TetR family [Lentilactobacillus parafarraginis DSM 18390 = JCM 14109]
MAIKNLQDLFSESLDETQLTAKQKAVLRASLKLFSDKGFDRTSTSDIAQLAGVSEGTVYKQFKTKDGILAAILGPFVQQVIPRAASEFSETITATTYPSFEEFLRTVIKNRIIFVIDNQRQLRIVLQEIITDNNMRQTFTKLIQELVSGPLGQAITHYQQAGLIVQWPVLRVFHYIAATIMSYAIPVALAGSSINTQKATDEAAEFLLKGLKP